MIPARAVGVGLRPPHYAEVLDSGADVDFFEVISENFMGDGGNARRLLRGVGERWPVALHGVSLGIGNIDPIVPDYLPRLRDLIGEIEPFVVSDHLCWGSHGGHVSHDLWPLPYTEEALAHVVSRVQHVQETLDRRIALENVSAYTTFRASVVPEEEFLAEVARRSGCAILLDVNNIYVSACNFGFDPDRYLDAIPPESVVQYHLAGHRVLPTHRLDTHDEPVCPEVWALYERAVARIGPRPTLVEWDDEIPSFERLVAEAHAAGARLGRGR